MTDAEKAFRQERSKEALDDLRHVITVDDDSLTRRWLEKYHKTIELALQSIALKAQEKPVEVTVGDLSGVINFGIDLKRAEALCHIIKNMYPNGLKIIEGWE